jgi:hypothetical protein
LFLRRGTLGAILRDTVATHLKHTCGMPGEVSRRRRVPIENAALVRWMRRAVARAVGPDTTAAPFVTVDVGNLSQAKLRGGNGERGGIASRRDRYALRTAIASPEQPSMMVRPDGIPAPLPGRRVPQTRFGLKADPPLAVQRSSFGERWCNSAKAIWMARICTLSS